MRLFLVRHGETNENREGIVQGWLDTELNDTGKQQAEQAALAFNEPIEAVISSDLRRCTQTAEPFRRKYPSVPYSEDARLRERCFGEAQGLHTSMHDWEVFWSVRDSVSIAGAETLDDFDARVRAFINEVRQQPYKSVLIVAHGGTVNRFLSIVEGNEGYQPVANSSVTRVELS
jgi:probable phosphoglycerate mutase